MNVVRTRRVSKAAHALFEEQPRYGHDIDQSVLDSVLNPHRFMQVDVPGEYDEANDEIKRAFTEHTGVEYSVDVQKLVDELATVSSTDRSEYLKSLKALKDVIHASTSNSQLAHNLVYNLLRLLNLQNAGDPFFFVSHSATHGVRVMDFAMKVFHATKSSLTVSQFTDAHKMEAAARITNILHDIGYATKNALSADKWFHAVSSARMVDHFLGADLESIFGSSVRHAIVEAIHKHNFDVQSSPKGVPGCDKHKKVGSQVLGDDVITLTVNGNPDSLTVFKKPANDAACLVERDMLERTYTPATYNHNAEDTLQVLVRFADNMDAQRKRLTEYQTGPLLVTFWAQMYFNDGLREGAACTKTKEDMLASARYKGKFDGSSKQLDAGIPAALVGAKYFDHNSFLHMWSNWIIKTIDVNSNWEVTVELFDDTDLAKQAAFIPFVTYYQIYRAASASASLTVGGSKLTDKVKVSVKQGTGNNPFLVKDVPLSSFNPEAFRSGEHCATDKSNFERMMNIKSGKLEESLKLSSSESFTASKPHPEHTGVLAKFNAACA